MNFSHLLQKLTIQKQPTRKTGFKRVGELPGQVRADLPAGRLMRESGVFPSLLLQRRSILGPAENQWMKKKGRCSKDINFCTSALIVDRVDFVRNKAVSWVV